MKNKHCYQDSGCWVDNQWKRENYEQEVAHRIKSIADSLFVKQGDAYIGVHFIIHILQIFHMQFYTKFYNKKFLNTYAILNQSTYFTCSIKAFLASVVSFSNLGSLISKRGFLSKSFPSTELEFQRSFSLLTTSTTPLKVLASPIGNYKAK